MKLYNLKNFLMTNNVNYGVIENISISTSSHIIILGGSYNRPFLKYVFIIETVTEQKERYFVLMCLALWLDWR